MSVTLAGETFTVILEEDAPLEYNFLNDIEATTVTAITNPQHGTLEYKDGIFSYSPNANYTGSDSFGFTANSVGYTVSVTITPVNDQPTTTSFSKTIDEDSSYQFQSSDFPFSDPDGDTLTSVVITNLIGSGELTYNQSPVTPGLEIAQSNLSKLKFQPSLNENGNNYAGFDFHVKDSQGDTSASQTMMFNVTPVNDAPTTNEQNINTSTNEEEQLTIPLTVSDQENDAATVSIASSPSHGTAEAINSGGLELKYTPENNFFGSDSFKYRVTDANGAYNEYTVSITVNNVDDTPEISESLLQFTTSEDTRLPGTLGPKDDGDNEKLTYQVATSQTDQGGSITINSDGTFTYTPNQNFYGTDSFTFSVTDQKTTVDYTATITVTSVNDPVVLTTSALSLEVSENSTDAGRIDLLGQTGATDADEGAQITFSLSQHDTNDPSTLTTSLGIAQIVDNIFTYQPKEWVIGTDTISYTVSDGQGFSASHTITVTIKDDPYNVIGGTEQDDHLAGNDGRETIYGGDGNDELSAKGGDDTLYGEAGNDRLDGGTGTNILSGGDGDDWYIINSIQDRVSEGNGAGIDGVEPLITNYTLPNNIEEARIVKDQSSLTGNSLDNRFIITSGINRTTIDGKEGNDTLSFMQLEHAVTFDLSRSTSYSLTSIENIEGTPYGDQLSADNKNNLLHGQDGNDILRGGSGNDTLIGGEGVDQLWGGEGNDIFVFTTLMSGQADTIVDFDPTCDRIKLSSTIFEQTFKILGYGDEVTADDRLLYNA
ncbi:MAG: tandem-95 repeat protein, partial [Campylobacterales bacterium]